MSVTWKQTGLALAQMVLNAAVTPHLTENVVRVQMATTAKERMHFISSENEYIGTNTTNVLRYTKRSTNPNTPMLSVRQKR